MVKYEQAKCLATAAKSRYHTFAGVTIAVEPEEYYEVLAEECVTFREAMAKLEDLAHSIKKINILRPPCYGLLTVIFDETVLKVGLDGLDINVECELIFEISFHNLEYFQCNFDINGMGEFISRHNNLKTITLSNAYVSRQFVETISTLPKLQSLNLKDCSNLQDLNSLAQAETIREIKIKYESISEAPVLNLVDLVASLPRLDRLEVDLEFNNRTYEQLEIYRRGREPFLFFYVNDTN